MSEKTYRIGEAAAKLNLKTYVLRFWEMEFPQITPIRTEKGQRLYRESDLAVLGRIRYLLHERGLTIEGARRLLREESARGVTYPSPGGQQEDIPDDLPAEELSPDEDADDGGEADTLEDSGTVAGDPVVGTGPEFRKPVQASLFAPGGQGAGLAKSDLDDIAAELRAIRSLLTF